MEGSVPAIRVSMIMSGRGDVGIQIGRGFGLMPRLGLGHRFRLRA